ncbi:MAG: sarcosine oxidase subunit gamma [Alphaproteobacteria bacterium]
MVDPMRIQGFEGLSSQPSAGNLVAFSAPVAGQASLRGRLQDAVFVEHAASTLGFSLPEDSRRASSNESRCVFRLSPDHWLALDDVDAGFGLRLEETDGLRAIDVSSTRARLRLQGAAVRDLLSVGAQIDLRVRAFPAGAFAQTPVGNATAILYAREDDVFDVLIARSFAKSWLVWLEHAGREFGLEISR